MKIFYFYFGVKDLLGCQRTVNKSKNEKMGNPLDLPSKYLDSITDSIRFNS